MTGMISQGACDSGTDIIIGPTPLSRACDTHLDKPLVYLSDRSHVWIKFIKGSQAYGARFSLDYASNVSGRCDFVCKDLCVLHKLRCDGHRACDDGEDELFCSTGDRSTTSYPVDLPPHADAGSDMIVTLPTTHVVLYGNRSTDDKKIISYRWTKITGGSVSMLGSRTSVLYLYDLEQGGYVFMLTVTDSSYQSSNSSVTVYVRPALYGQTTKSAVSPTKQCDYGEIYCYVKLSRQYKCLHNMYKCNGERDCVNGEDEQDCGEKICNRRLENMYGWFASPNYPDLYPKNANCSWVIHPQVGSGNTFIELQVIDFKLERMPGTDSVSIYNGPDSTYDLIGRYYGYYKPPPMITSTGSWLNIVFKSDSYQEYMGFNFTYQIRNMTSPRCASNQSPCTGENKCYNNIEKCDGVRDCPTFGSDELGCEPCGRSDYTCGRGTTQCYRPSERCNGIPKCANYADEEQCSSVLCGAHNGTFLCDNKRCIYEKYTCDGRNDCGDKSDERSCGTTKRVIIAAISGSMVCALLLVVLLGCSCKLYQLRTMDYAPYPRHETPMSRLYAELMRRRAPPPYHEAMLTSRNFDEVQQEYMERLRNASRRSQRRHRRSRSSRNLQTNDNGEVREENVENNENGPTVVGNTIQMGSVAEQGENSNHCSVERSSSTAELLPSDSDTDSSDLDDDLDTDLDSRGEGQVQSRSGGQVVITDAGGNGNNDDEENILASASLSAQWARNVNSDGDEVCILNEEAMPEVVDRPSHCDNVSIDTEASASIVSLENQEGNIGNEDDKNDSEDEVEPNPLDVQVEQLENSRNSTPKPENCGENRVIETSDGFLMRGPSQNSLDSTGSETYSENEVPLQPVDRVSQF